MKRINGVISLLGFMMFLLAFGFILRVPLVTALWPWPDGRLSYLFIGSILGAVSAAALWIGLAGEPGVLSAGALNVFVIALGTSIYFFYLALREGRSGLLSYGFASVLSALVSGITFLWSRRLAVDDSLPTPLPVRISFGIFVVALVLAGTGLILRAPIFPWALNPDSSIIFGCIFIGDAFYFLHALLYPYWHNARGQLLSFLAYDLVLIGPFLQLMSTVDPALRLNLMIYIVVLLYSGALAVYFLFFNVRMRMY